MALWTITIMFVTTLACSDKASDTGSDTATPVVTDDTGEPGTAAADHSHAFTVTAGEAFETRAPIERKGEETFPICSDCPEGVTVTIDDPLADTEVIYAGTLDAGTHSFSYLLQHSWDGPAQFTTVEAIITAE